MKKLKIGVFLHQAGHHIAGWRHPLAKADFSLNFPAYRDAALTAERGLLDVVFVADNVGIRHRGGRDVECRQDYVSPFEPSTLMSALAAVTSHVGLVASATTSYNEPFNLARRFASIDHLSGGRAGWNLVTSWSDVEARNFGQTHMLPPEIRYERAREFVAVVRGLWDSFADDAFTRDKASGIYYDPDKLKPLNFEGKYFSVSGPLNIARPPQGWPVLFQAGSSTDGIALGAAVGEVAFTVQATLDSAQAFYRRIKDEAVNCGRSPDDILVMPGLAFIVAPTREQAREREAELQELLYPPVGLGQLSEHLDFDLSGYPLDGPVPDVPETRAHRSRQQVLLDTARRENMTLGQLSNRNAISKGHPAVIGTAADVADFMEEWLKKEAADGFNIEPSYLPGGLTEFVDLVVPELQRRGIFRTRYEGRTLRENLGLRRPARFRQ